MEGKHLDLKFRTGAAPTDKIVTRVPFGDTLGESTHQDVYHLLAPSFFSIGSIRAFVRVDKLFTFLNTEKIKHKILSSPP